MALGSYTSPGVQIEFTPGVWTTITSYVRGGVSMSWGRKEPTAAFQPGELVFELNNRDGRFTGDNVLSPYYPNMVEGRRVRVFLTPPGGSATWRGWYTIRRVSGDPFGDTVTVTATDRLASLTRRPFKSDAVERIRSAALIDGVWADVWPLRKTGKPNLPDNAGRSTSGLSKHRGRLVHSKPRRGEANYVEPDGLMVEGAVELKPKGTTGPVLQFKLQDFPQRIGAFFNTRATPPADPGDWTTLMQGRAIDGTELWSARYFQVSGSYDLEFYAGDGYEGRITTELNDEAWHSLELRSDGAGNTYVYYDLLYDGETTANAFTVVGLDVTDTFYLVLGGSMNPFSRGKQTRCIHATYALPWAQGASSFTIEPYAREGGSDLLQNRVGDYIGWAGVGSLGWLVEGTQGTSRTVARTSSLGRNVTDCLQDLADSVTGTAWISRTNDGLYFTPGDVLRQKTVAATITLGDDDDATLTPVWTRGALEAPTRATVVAQEGTETYVDEDAEAYEERDAGTFDSMLVTTEEAYSLASWRVTAGRSLRLSALKVNAVTALTSGLWAALLAAVPGTRFRVAGLDPTRLGRSYVDVHVIGAEEVHDKAAGESSFVLYFAAADDPAEGVWDDTTYGRYSAAGATVTGGTAMSGSGLGTGTLTIATLAYPDGRLITTDPAHFPQDLDWNGERITVSGVTGASSPQTATVTARGVAPTVARVHSTGEPVDVWMAAHWAG